jgi:cation transport ATPase
LNKTADDFEVSLGFVLLLALLAGVIGHEGSTVVVILNGLRLLRSRSMRTSRLPA